MSLAHQSIATINSPEFINLQQLDINPLMSSCEIKVLYVGTNRNGSYISKQVATEMAKTLRGAPIVGYYKESKEDFADHGQQMIFDDEGIHFNTLTKPYGFVSPDAQVWFQDFEEQDDFGNSITRTYLMTTGYLWSGQFKEAQAVIDQGKPQSMQLDENSLKGHWATNVKQNMEFFIINDAIFSKLCILGDDVEPCFEGAAVTSPNVSKNFTLDDNFKKTLFNMMEDLKFALKGGNTVANIQENVPEVQVEETTVETPVVEFAEEVQENENASSEENVENIDTSVESTFEEKKKQEQDEDTSDEDKEDDSESKEEEDKEDEKKKYSLLEERYNTLQSAFDSLQEEVEGLREFKASIEDKQKSDLIDEFCMLSDEDKKDVVENKANYSLEEIKAKLAVICFEKKVSFNSETSDENENMAEKETTVTFNVENDDSSTPDWIKAVEETMKNRL